jgi:hypothetical protein
MSHTWHCENVACDLYLKTQPAKFGLDERVRDPHGNEGTVKAMSCPECEEPMIYDGGQ